MMRSLCCASIVSFAAFPTIALAQSAPESLAIVIETPTAETIVCGVTANDIRATIRSAMRYNRIQENSESTVFVHVNLQGYRVTPAMCAGTYRLSISAFGMTELGGTMRWTTNTFCEQSYLLSGPNLSRFREPIRQHFDACLSTMQDNLAL